MEVGYVWRTHWRGRGGGEWSSTMLSYPAPQVEERVVVFVTPRSPISAHLLHVL